MVSSPSYAGRPPKCVHTRKSGESAFLIRSQLLEVAVNLLETGPIVRAFAPTPQHQPVQVVRTEHRLFEKPRTFTLIAVRRVVPQTAVLQHLFRGQVSVRHVLAACQHFPNCHAVRPYVGLAASFSLRVKADTNIKMLSIIYAK